MCTQKTMCKLSVIIPVYNAAPYIERCARSLMEQTLVTGVEFLFIDDGSSDDSISLLKHAIEVYPQRKDQVRVLCHQENKGVAYTREEGILLAQGEFIGWCDSDDWCERTMFERMYEQAHSDDADIVVCDYLVHEKLANRKESKNYNSDPREHIRLLYRQPDANIFLWHKIFKKELLLKNDILPFKDINVGEDQNLSIRAFCCAHRLSYLPQILYHHDNTNPSSIVSVHTRKSSYRLTVDCRNTDAICNYLEKEGAEEFFLTTQFLRFQTKWGFEALLGFSKTYYDLYACSHPYIMKFTGIPFVLRLKMALLFHSFFSFRLVSAAYLIKKHLIG